MSTVIPAESLPRVNRYAVMLCDWNVNQGSANGVLTERELVHYIDTLQDEYSSRDAIGESTQFVSDRIADCERMLEDMRAAGVDGLDYLPPQVRDADLSPELRARAVEILKVDGSNNGGNITRNMLAKARARYSGSARTPGSSQNLQRALDEIKKLGAALDL